MKEAHEIHHSMLYLGDQLVLYPDPVRRWTLGRGTRLAINMAFLIALGEKKAPNHVYMYLVPLGYLPFHVSAFHTFRGEQKHMKDGRPHKAIIYTYM